jgi:hypothetical protein
LTSDVQQIIQMYSECISDVYQCTDDRK